MKEKYSVLFNSDECIGCGLCCKVCPRKIILQNQTNRNIKEFNFAFIEDESRCIGCGSCLLVCPKSVIKIIKIK